MPILFHAEEVSLPNFEQSKTINWINLVIDKEKKIPGDINIIFTSDSYLIEMNNKYLEHDYYTDIITFDYCEDNIISGDIFISIDRIKENADAFKVTFNNELFRVIIHGILHLVGYNDHNEDEKKIMRKNENKYLKLINHDE